MVTGNLKPIHIKVTKDRVQSFHAILWQYYSFVNAAAQSRMWQKVKRLFCLIREGKGK